MNLLFVCTAHLNRSVTAEGLFRTSKANKAKSAGIGILCDVRVNEKLVRWADIVFVMDEENEGQKSYILDKFKRVPGIKKKVQVLGITDDYSRGSPELVSVLKKKLSEYLKLK